MARTHTSRRRDLEDEIRLALEIDIIVEEGPGVWDEKDVILTVSLDPPKLGWYRVEVAKYFERPDEWQVNGGQSAVWTDSEYKAVLAAVRYCQYLELSK